MTSSPDPGPPERYVDAFTCTWKRIRQADHALYGLDRVPPPPADTWLTADQLHQQRGPLRPVVPPTSLDTDQLRDAIRAAGPLTVATLVRALTTVWIRHNQTYASDDGLIAGRPHSAESLAITFMVTNTASKLNELAEPDHPAARDAIETVLARWILAPDSYTEVGENLADTLAAAAEELGGLDALTTPVSRACCHQLVQHYLVSRSPTHRITTL